MADQKNAVAAPRPQSAVAEIRHGLERMRPEIAKVLPEHVTAEKFERVALTAIQRNPDLLEADRRSLFGACLDAATDGLVPDGREGAIVTFKGKAQWMPMVAGILKKVRQSGEIAALSAHVVHEHDDFDHLLGDDERIYHKPRLANRGEIIAAYAIAELRDGCKIREVMGVDEIERVRSVSRASRGGPWEKWYGEMARKTVIRRLAKRLPMSTDLEVVYRDDRHGDPSAADADPAAPRRISKRGGISLAAPKPEPEPEPVIEESEPDHSAAQAAFDAGCAAGERGDTADGCPYGEDTDEASHWRAGFEIGAGLFQTAENG